MRYSLEKLKIKNPRGIVETKPIISVYFYLAKPLLDIRISVADAIKQYIQFIGPAVFMSYLTSDEFEPWGRLTNDQVKSDLEELKSQEAGFYYLEYQSNDDNLMGDYGVFFRGGDLSLFPGEEVNHLRFDFPAKKFEENEPEIMVTFIKQLSEKMPFQSGGVGFSFKRNAANKTSATPFVNSLLPRYYGFDPYCYEVAFSLNGYTFSPHWITLINNVFIEKLGGYNQIRSSIPHGQITKSGNGIFIRASKFPPIGDVNRRCTDIGCLPDVARALKPTRVELSGLGDAKFDVMAWLGRFDDMENRDWDNSSINLDYLNREKDQRFRA